MSDNLEYDDRDYPGPPTKVGRQFKILQKLDIFYTNYNKSRISIPTQDIIDMCKIQERNAQYTFEHNQDRNVFGIVERIKRRMENENTLLLDYEVDFLNKVNRMI